MIEEQLRKLRNLTAAITEEGISQERLQQVIKAINVEVTEFRYRFDGVYLPVGPVIDGSVVYPQEERLLPESKSIDVRGL